MINEKVIVVGAGIAGLAAARKLVDFGFRVTILEGRQRVGGRIWTDHSVGTPIDLGAAWIHGCSGNPLTTLADELSVSRSPTDYDSLNLFDTDGSPLDDDSLEAIEELIEGAIDELLGAKNEAAVATSIADQYKPLLAGAGLTGVQRRGIEWGMVWEIELDQADDLDSLSLTGFEEDNAFSGEDELFPGGYSQLVNGLASNLDVRLGETVEEIKYDSDGITVVANGVGWRGDRAVVTLPLGVLKADSVAFVPTLPTIKKNSIQRLEMGTLNKIVLRFDEAFWPTSTQFFGLLKSTRSEMMSIANLLPHLDQPILVALARGNHARALEGGSDTNIVSVAMEDVRGMFGPRVPEPTATTVTRWNSDPFCFGSYAHLPPGATPADYDALAEPIAQRLFFAGEATNRQYPGTVHGAFLSGQHQAQVVADIALS